MKNARCWARKFDNCSSTISGEHRVSVAAWSGTDREAKLKRPMFFWQGQLRSDGRLDTNVPGGFLRRMPLNTFTANVLCKDHNNELTKTDQAAGSLTQALAGFFDTWKKRSIPGLTYAPKVFRVDGPTIERWFIKTVIANMVQYDHRIGAFDAEPGTPTDELVDIAFGKSPAAGFIGLHGAGAVDWSIDDVEHFGFMPWFWQSRQDPERKYLAGALAEYRGLRFVVNLDKHIPPPLEYLRRTPTWQGFDLLSPLKLLQAPRVALFIELDWPS